MTASHELQQQQSTAANNYSDVEILRKELSGSKSNHRNVVRRVINLMNQGIDLSPIFADMLRISQTDDLKLKKMIYIYLMEFSHKNRDLAIMTVNTIIKDSTSSNPIIRAMATRAIGQMDFEAFGEYLFDQSLKKSIGDRDPYVRKSAVIVIVRVIMKSPEVAKTYNLMNAFLKCLTDVNPAVVSNTIACLNEMMEMSMGDKLFEFDFSFVSKLLILLNDCNFWAKDPLFAFIFKYEPRSVDEIKLIVDAMLKHVSDNHTNVVFGAVKNIFKFVNLIQDPREKSYIENCTMSSVQAILTLLYCGNTYQYAVLKNIQLLNRCYPGIFGMFVSSFLLKHNDEIYIRVQKLKVLTEIATPDNLSKIIEELSEVQNEMNEQLLLCALDCIEALALKFPSKVKYFVLLLDKFLGKNIEKVKIRVLKLFGTLAHCEDDFSPMMMNTISKLDDQSLSDRFRSCLLPFLADNLDKVENIDQILRYIASVFSQCDKNLQLACLKFAYEVNKSKKSPEASKDCLKALFDHCLEPGCDIFVRDMALLYWRTLSNSLSVPKAKKKLKSGKNLHLESQVNNLAYLLHMSSLLDQKPETFCQTNSNKIDSAITKTPRPVAKMPQIPALSKNAATVTKNEAEEPDQFDTLIEFD